VGGREQTNESCERLPSDSAKPLKGCGQRVPTVIEIDEMICAVAQST
jgi:hypothetical protein